MDHYYSQVQGATHEPKAGGWTYSCDTHVPDFTFLLKEYRGTIPGNLITYGPAVRNGTMCFGGIQPRLSNIPFDIWGEIMFKAQFVVFDGGEHPRLGFAPKSVAKSLVEEDENEDEGEDGEEDEEKPPLSSSSV